MTSEEVNSLLDRFRTTGAFMRLVLFGGTIGFAVAVFEPRSLITVLFGGQKLIPTGVALLAFIGGVETVINDLMTNRFSWARMQKVRHVLLIGCFFFFAATIGLCIEQEVSWAAYPVFALFMLGIVFHTFLDLRARYKR